MSPSKFRAIIIGGGPVGLTIANGLERADLDFIVIERYPTIISESGAGIMLWPHSVRILDQLGLAESCEGRYIPLHEKSSMRLDGTPLRTSPLFKYLLDNHGYPCMNFPRPALIQTLLDSLRAKESKIRTGVGIDEIQMTEGGVRVLLSDGSVEDGSIIIGADGVHSRTRTIMHKLAEEAGDDFPKAEEPLVSNYQIMYGRAKYVPNAEIGHFYETHGTYMSSQISADERRMHFGIYRKLPNPTTSLKKEYTEEEVAEFVEAFSDVMVMPKVSFSELYRNCEWTKLVNQPEGLLKRWHYGRIVLAGDACASMTAAAGMGVNNGLQSAVRLVNGLHDALSDGVEPNAEMFKRVFEEYENARREESRFICDLAARMIRVNTWDSYLTWFIGDVFFPWMLSDEKLMTKVGNDLLRKMRKFNFIEADLKSGKIPWISS
ncbi:putative FAD binding domain-containing protein [Rosellinia necatrix]|uniref:Putative FAD binding domain-containing protein n=1 Tax=Rosellinia necatrix TaxID=77044 RepID=A0A1W2TKL4_ROSNE|nr:putative FAD binding domain-containing protein [Rosellinia necatrix]